MINHGSSGKKVGAENHKQEHGEETSVEIIRYYVKKSIIIIADCLFSPSILISLHRDSYDLVPPHLAG